jgi:hypothetical protein
MRDSVDKTISTINSELTQIREALKNPPFTDEDKEPDEILKELDRMRARLDGFKQQIQTVQGIRFSTIIHYWHLPYLFSRQSFVFYFMTNDSSILVSVILTCLTRSRLASALRNGGLQLQSHCDLHQRIRVQASILDHVPRVVGQIHRVGRCRFLHPRCGRSRQNHHCILQGMIVAVESSACLPEPRFNLS